MPPGVGEVVMAVPREGWQGDAQNLRRRLVGWKLDGSEKTVANGKGVTKLRPADEAAGNKASPGAVGVRQEAEGAGGQKCGRRVQQFWVTWLVPIHLPSCQSFLPPLGSYRSLKDHQPYFHYLNIQALPLLLVLAFSLSLEQFPLIFTELMLSYHH